MFPSSKLSFSLLFEKLFRFLSTFSMATTIDNLPQLQITSDY